METLTTAPLSRKREGLLVSLEVPRGVIRPKPNVPITPKVIARPPPLETGSTTPTRAEKGMVFSLQPRKRVPPLGVEGMVTPRKVTTPLTEPTSLSAGKPSPIPLEREPSVPPDVLGNVSALGFRYPPPIESGRNRDSLRSPQRVVPLVTPLTETIIHTSRKLVAKPRVETRSPPTPRDPDAVPLVRPTTAPDTSPRTTGLPSPEPSAILPPLPPTIDGVAIPASSPEEPVMPSHASTLT